MYGQPIALCITVLTLWYGNFVNQSLWAVCPMYGNVRANKGAILWYRINQHHRWKSSWKGSEKTIKGHACHELTTTALAVAPWTINPSSTRNVCSQCFFFFSTHRLCPGRRLYSDGGLQAVQEPLQCQECPCRLQRSTGCVSVGRDSIPGCQGSGVYAPFLQWFVTRRLHFFWVGGCSSLSQASILGSLLCGSDEAMHAEVGQVQRPGA